MSDDKKQLYQELGELVRNAKAALEQAEIFAVQHKLSFFFQPAYGMGGTYEGDPERHAENKEYNYNATGAITGWSPSAGSC